VTAVAGSNTFYAWAKDAAGNVSAVKSATVVVTIAVVDITAPIVTFTLPATATSLTVPASFTATDNVAVTGYLINKSATAPAATATGWTGTAPTSVTAIAGSNTFYAWAKDAAGNVSAVKSATVVVTISTADTTPPTLNVSALANGSFTNKVTLNISGNASDAGGLKSVTVNGQAAVVNADGSFSTALTLVVGANTITVVATDQAGNKTTNSRTVTYDPTAPVLTVSAPADNSTSVQSFVTVSGTVNENSTVTVSVNSGTAQSAAMTGTGFTATANLVPGINTINITATDQAGNTTSAKRTVTYSAPASQLTLAVTNPRQDVTTSKSEMTIRGTVTDAAGAVKVIVKVNSRSYTPEMSSTGAFSKKVSFSRAGAYVITVTATDLSGNTATVTRNVIYRPQSRDDDHDGD
jgi:membrane-bound inhibitor of C-type lysozyme